MNPRDNSLALLPNGFVDTLPPKAELEAKAIRTLMKTYGGFGYQRIKPPMLEFEDSLFADGPGSSLSKETFRLMDPVSHRMMGIRADITPQVARIALSRLAGEERPLRLMYANDVLRTRGTQTRTERQFTQVGCELITDFQADAQNDVEICMLAILGLKAINIENLTVDFTIPGLVSTILKDYHGQDRDSIIKSVAHRDHDVLAKHKDKVVQKLADIMDLRGDADTVLDGLLKLKVGQKEDIQNLKVVISAVQKACSETGITDVSFTVDALEQAGFEYHKGLGFTFFAPDMRGELGRGGRYDLQFGSGGKPQTAIGFTVYMDTIARSLKLQAPEKILAVPSSENWSVLKDLQAQGWTTIRIPDNKIPAYCTHNYKNGKIEEIS
ncbi:MAG: ATP phosphoribosyltransferase regulatory subunit [Alphaproteobacteria bacterium]|nr:ATP phosphoribosyltransferase regulatory subunit [Alphaproteobacteria bacterium]